MKTRKKIDTNFSHQPHILLKISTFRSSHQQIQKILLTVDRWQCVFPIEKSKRYDHMIFPLIKDATGDIKEPGEV